MSPHELLLPFLGLVTGLLLGALGSGGSILAMPAFLYAGHLPVKSAVATSLFVVGAVSLIGALLAKRRCVTSGCPGQEVDGRVTVLMTAGGLVGAYTGSRLAVLIPSEVQLLLFAGIMLAASVGMFRRRPSDPDSPVNSGSASGSQSPRYLVLLLGLGVGLLTGVVGVGGGFLIVPALTLMARAPVKRAAAMSLWIIAANSAAGLVGYIGHVPIAWASALVFLVISIFGMVVGQTIARSANPHGLRVSFAVFLVLVGGYTVVKTTTKPPAKSHSVVLPQETK